MEMPNECRDCRMMVYHENTGKTWCSPADAILAEDWNPIPFDGRPDWCPLVEVKEPHGRLIDENRVIRLLALGWEANKYPAARNIFELPAEIEAEGAEE